ncbi:MAG: GDSL-type esterase/lipase family protein [Armatimonadota bacterium]
MPTPAFRAPAASRSAALLTAVLLLASTAWALHTQAEPAASEEVTSPEWREAARRTHARFTGQPGTVAQFGDSITVTQAFWTPLRYERRNAPPELEAAFRRVNTKLRPECWADWKGPAFGSEGGQTTRWAEAHVDEWLKKLRPELAVLLFGTNDLHSLELPEYRRRLLSVARRCQEQGTVPILTTVPPRHGFEQKAEQLAQAGREVARELSLPLIDYHAEIVRRRPDDWDGALDRFKEFDTYEVPTLISRDGVHPSYPTRFQNDYSEAGLRSSGYTLRNYLTLLKVAEVLQALETPPRPEAAGADRGRAAVSPPGQPWHPQAPPLPRPTGEVIRVATAAQLYEAAARVRPGGTILLADGEYALSRHVEIRTDGVTLRGESGDRHRVVLDGGGTLGEAIWITACSGVTLADLTVQNVRWNGIKINSDTGVQRLRIYNCVLHNIWQRAVKGVKVPAEGRERLRPRDFRIEYCLFYNDRPKRFSDDPADTPENFNGDYVGGIDVMYPQGWTVSDNVFLGIQGRNREARGAIFLWHDARDCLVERNVIVDCDSGICLGNGQPPPDSAVHASGCTVRNNLITRAPENGILADFTRDCAIVHNTVYDPAGRLRRGIRVVDAAEGLYVANNLLSGPKILVETSSPIRLGLNREEAPAALFVDASAGNLRLAQPAPGLVDAAPRLPQAPDDLDRRRRGSRADLGAHELSPE